MTSTHLFHRASQFLEWYRHVPADYFVSIIGDDFSEDDDSATSSDDYGVFEEPDNSSLPLSEVQRLTGLGVRDLKEVVEFFSAGADDDGHMSKEAFDACVQSLVDFDSLDEGVRNVRCRRQRHCCAT